MLYFSIALVVIAVIVTVKPISITINRTYKMIETPIQTQEGPGEPEKMDELNKQRPPNMENMVAKLNEIMLEIGGQDE